MSGYRYARIALVALLPLIGLHPQASGAASTAPFAGLFGGSGEDRIRAMAADATGAIFIAGATSSGDLAVLDPFQRDLAGGTDAFVAKIAADGRTVLFATYLGGAGDDEALALVPDGNGGVWVAGVTDSENFPVRDALQPSAPGGGDGFLAHIAATGSDLLSSTYLGGTGGDRAAAVALDGNRNPWVAGTTTSTDLPTTDGTFQPYAMGGSDGFLLNVTLDGTSLLQGTYFGGSGDDEACALLAGGGGSLVVAGRTTSADFPLAAPSQSTWAGGWDGFVARLDGGAVAPAFSTYLGGTGDDEVCSLATGGSGFACAGMTGSSDFPFWSGLEPGPAGGTDGFVAAFSAQNDLRYLAPVGGSGDDAVLAVAQDGGGAVVLVGSTTSADLPLRAAAVEALAGATDGFLVRVAPGGTSVTYATYLGGSGDDELSAVAFGAGGSVMVAGRTDSADFSTGGAGIGATAGAGDGFLGRVPTAPLAPVDLVVNAVALRSISLSWVDAGGGRGSFELERRSGGGSFSPLASVPAGTTSFVDDTVAPSSTYAYRVLAVVDGTPSAFSNEVAAITPVVPVPVRPGTPVVEALSPRTVRVQWEDRSDDELSFEVFRSVDGGAPALLKSLSADTTVLDDVVTPDRTWTYAVRAVGVTGASPLTSYAGAATAGTLSVDPLKGKRRDGSRTGRDSVSLVLSLSTSDGASLPDPRTGGIQIGVGAVDGAAVVSAPAGSAGWTERGDVLRWKSPKGSSVKASLVFDRARGTLRVKASGLELGACDADAVRVWVRCAPEAGSSVESWLEKRPGLLVTAD